MDREAGWERRFLRSWRVHAALKKVFLFVGVGRCPVISGFIERKKANDWFTQSADWDTQNTHKLLPRWNTTSL